MYTPEREFIYDIYTIISDMDNLTENYKSYRKHRDD